MATGHLNPSLPIAAALRELKHEVHYLSRDEMRPMIEKTGASFSSMASEQSELYDGREQDIMGCFRALAQELEVAEEPMMVSLLKTAPYHLELQLPGTIRWMQRVRPDVVLFCPFMNPEAVYAAKYLNIPAIGLWTFAGPGSMVGIVDMFLMQTGLEPTEVLNRVEGFEPMLQSIQRLKESYGFHLDYRGFLEPKGFLSTMTETNFNLVTTGADLQDPLPENLAKRYQDSKFITVGPLLTQPEKGSNEDVSGEVEAVKEIKLARDAGRKVILVSMGTILTSNTADLGWSKVPRDGSEAPRGLTGKQLCQSAWSAAFEAFGETGEEENAPLLIVAIGSQPDALEGVDVPKNARCFPYLPQVEVLKAGVDLFLTHGGQNSFMESLMAGTPVVVCPGFGDQIANAMRAEMTGDAYADAKTYEEEKKAEAIRRAEEEAARQAAIDAGEEVPEAGEPPEEKPLTMRGTDVKMVLCLDTLGQQLSTNTAFEEGNAMKILELAKASACSQCKSKTEFKQVDNQVLSVIDETHRNEIDEKVYRIFAGPAALYLAAQVVEVADQVEQGFMEQLEAEQELIQKKFAFLKALQVAKEMHQLIGGLTSWVYTTSDVMNVVAVPWRKSTMDWQKLKTLLNDPLVLLEKVVKKEVEGKDVPPEHLHNFILQMASPAEMDAEKAKDHNSCATTLEHVWKELPKVPNAAGLRRRLSPQQEISPAFQLLYNLVQANEHWRCIMVHRVWGGADGPPSPPVVAAAPWEEYEGPALEDLDDDFKETA
ncbi:Uncharacterized UDP-glucosyltransferase YdhE [Durusdinium trenchii]|uniref:Uncharacterized UDP-glucosyltransferase YdhE n=1 Tax=Durusdinium trenchii TaxID=1381693 RepID=A0ABP0QS42_9DINO